MRAVPGSFLILSLLVGWPAARGADKAGNLAARLGYEGCKLKPLTLAQAMAIDMSGGTELSRSHPDWDELLAQYQAGDQIYLIDCKKVDASRMYSGITLHVLVRAETVIARAT
jgi:hypothetical protein